MFRLPIWFMIVISLTDAQLSLDDIENSTTFSPSENTNAVPNFVSTSFPETNTDSSRILELDHDIIKNNESESENSPNIQNIRNSDSNENTTGPENDNKDGENVEKRTDSYEGESINSKNSSSSSSGDGFGNFGMFNDRMWPPEDKFEPNTNSSDGFGPFMPFKPPMNRMPMPMGPFGNEEMESEKKQEEEKPRQVETTVRNLLLEERIAEIEAELLAVFKEKIPEPKKKSENQSLDSIEIFRGRMAMEAETVIPTIPQYDFGTDAVVQEPDSKNELEEKAKKENMQKLSLGDFCTLATSHLCENFPRVTCQRKEASGGIQNYYCACSHLHTQHSSPEKGQYCVANVFTPCSDLTGDIFPCGENMKCQNDSLGIDGFKYCRCLPGFIPQENEDFLPATCIPYNGTEIVDIAEDYQSVSFLLCPLSFLVFSNLFFLSFHNI